jgi:competence protein ComEC
LDRTECRDTPAPGLPIRKSAPLAWPALALAAGVAADRHLLPLPTPLWLGGLGLLLASAALALQRGVRRVARWLLLAAAATWGAAWHHTRWNDLAPDDLARWRWPESGSPAWVRGVVVDEPTFFSPDAARGPSNGQTRLIVHLEAICDGAAWQPVSGRLLAQVGGAVAGLRMGDRIRLAGLIRPIGRPTNPGEPDPRQRWQSDGIRLRLTVKSAAALVREQPAADPWQTLLGNCRRRSHALVTAPLPPDVAALAAGLLLGRRETIDPDLQDAFLRSGTIHWLAISGLHMHTLAVVVGSVLARTPLGPRGAAVVVLAASGLYTLLVGAAASVVRSAIMTAAWCLALLLNRPSHIGNALALAALGLLILNPTTLFDRGAQLSFLSVAGLVWGVSGLQRAMIRRIVNRPSEPPLSPAEALDRLERIYAPLWLRAWRGAWAGLGMGIAASALLWAIGLPLVLQAFHVVAWVAILLNVVLVPLSAPALTSALVVLIAAPLAPPLAEAAGWVCGWVLRVAQALVVWGATLPSGHHYAPGPPRWWIVGFYVALTASLRPRLKRYGQAGLVACGAMALGLWLFPQRPSSLEAEVLDVDHGLAILVQAPSGRTLLYDCGRMRDPRVGRQVVAPALWARGVRRLDVIVLSHADYDHLSGVGDLLDRFAVGELRTPPGFDAHNDPAVAELLATCRRRRVPVRPIAAGATIDLGPGVICRALHPPPGWRPEASDNARSVVLDLRFQDRGFLLTGDLDGPGTEALLATEPPVVDVLLAPHHGGRTANPARLYAWADPKVVIVSQAAPAGPWVPELAALEREGRSVRSTGLEGAIRLTWTDHAIAVRGVGGDQARPTERLVVAAVVAWETGLLGLIALVGGLAVCLVLAVVEWGAWALVCPGRRAESPLEPPPWKPIEATARDGTRLAGAWCAGQPDRPVMLLLHGFAEDRSALLGRARLCLAQGWSVAILDARARGRSGGALGTFGARESDDLQCWIETIAAARGDRTEFAAWGRSMGAVIALRAAAEGAPLRALVLEAPYADLAGPVRASLRRLRLPAALAGWILRRAARIAGTPLDRPRPIEWAARVRVPTLLIHGSNDPVAPPSEVLRLAAAFPIPPDRIEVAGAGHSDLFDVGGPALEHPIAAFLNRPHIPHAGQTGQIKVVSCETMETPAPD